MLKIPFLLHVLRSDNTLSTENATELIIVQHFHLENGTFQNITNHLREILKQCCYMATASVIRWGKFNAVEGSWYVGHERPCCVPPECSHFVSVLQRTIRKIREKNLRPEKLFQGLQREVAEELANGWLYKDLVRSHYGSVQQ